MEKIKTQEQLEKDQDKDLQTKLNSYVEVARHKLGRTPSLEEVLELMKESGSESERTSELPAAQAVPMLEQAEDEESDPELDAEQAQAEPKILGMKVYHGLSGEGDERKPDERKILYYEAPDGMVYDCSGQQWIGERPPVLDHLNCRDIQHNDEDIVQAIANGVMDDDDYNALSSAGLVGETPDKLWKLTKKLSMQIDEMEKDHAAEGLEDLEKSEDDESDSHQEESNDYDSIPFDEGEVFTGDDHIQEMMTAAASLALTGMEDQIRAIVREEMGLNSSQVISESDLPVYEDDDQYEY